MINFVPLSSLRLWFPKCGVKLDSGTVVLLLPVNGLSKLYIDLGRIQKKTLSEAQRTQGIEFINWVNFSARRVQNWFQWYYMDWSQVWPPDDATCIYYKFDLPVAVLASVYKLGHQGAPLALIENWVTKWPHLHSFKIWPSGGATCIGFKVVH